MSKPEKRDDRKTAQLSCWVDADNLQKARDKAASRGERLNKLVDRALAREVDAPAGKDDSDEA